MTVKGRGNGRNSGEVAAVPRITGDRMAEARGYLIHPLFILTRCEISMRKGAPANGEGPTARQGSAAFQMVSENWMSRRRSKSGS